MIGIAMRSWNYLLSRGTSCHDLKLAGGWSGNMPERYTLLLDLANEGVILGEKGREKK